MASSSNLPKHPLFAVRVERLSVDERVALAYKRAALVMKTYKLSATDVETCSEKFWRLFTDPIHTFDIGMFTILAAHIGLAIGTLSRHLDAQPDLRPLVDDLLQFKKVGLFLLTERGHGTDSFNIETTATRLADGSYILNTPREEASKFMPASTPLFGMSKVALVMARLIQDGKDYGCRYFIVPICNEHEMLRGVQSTRLPTRSGTSPLDFSITSFHNVRLPATALVSSTPFTISAPTDPLAAWWDENWRIQLGTLLVVAPFVHSIKIAAFTVGSYSMHRCIVDRSNSTLKPIFEFRTQQWPVASAVAMGYVLEAWYCSEIRNSADRNVPQNVRHALAVITKTTVFRQVLRIVPELGERCGAQGTFEPNFMARILPDGVGGAVAEGELLTLCIRLFSELLLGRYTIALPPPEQSLLAQHAHGVLAENKQLLATLGGHRNPQFETLIMPQSMAVIEAIGHALAYSAALASGVAKPLLDMYECAAMRQDPAWYSEEARISRAAQRLRDDRVVASVIPDIERYLGDLDVGVYATAPIVSDQSWKQYAAGLPTYTGNAKSVEMAPLAML